VSISDKAQKQSRKVWRRWVSVLLRLARYPVHPDRDLDLIYVTEKLMGEPEVGFNDVTPR
jgi:hypothetical protein